MLIIACVCRWPSWTPKTNPNGYKVVAVWFAFGVKFGLQQTHALIEIKTIRRGKVPPTILLKMSNLILISNVDGGTFPLLIVLILISACVCRRPIWKPKIQPGGSSAATWLSFWYSTRLLMPEKKWPAWRGKPCRGLPEGWSILWGSIYIIYHNRYIHIKHLRYS